MKKIELRIPYDGEHCNGKDWKCPFLAEYPYCFLYPDQENGHNFHFLENFVNDADKFVFKRLPICIRKQPTLIERGA